MACVVLRPGTDQMASEDVRRHLERLGFARWQVPDRFELVDEIPKTSVGKFDKKILRERFARLPEFADRSGIDEPSSGA